MKRKENFLLAFAVFILLSFLLLGLSKFGILAPVSSVLQKITTPFQSVTYNFVNSITLFGENAKLKKLQSENLSLTSMLSDQKKLQEENSALSDQFQASLPNSNTLLPAGIVGAPSFIPGISIPETFILDKGKNDGLKVGDAVLYKNNLLGSISQLTASLAKVQLVTNAASSFTAKTASTQALGVIQGQGGGQMILNNVVLSDNLKVSDLVLTNGDTNLNGEGYPPDLVVGKIVSIDKKASALFQRAEVASFIDFTKITTVFVLLK